MSAENSNLKVKTHIENQEIRIEVKDGKYFLSRYKDGKVKEQYCPESKEGISVWVISVLNGFQPPRRLIELDKLIV